MKKHMFARIACALLATLMLATAAVSCGGTGNGETTTQAGYADATTAGGNAGGDAAGTAASGETTTPAGPAVDAKGYVLDDLPGDLNYNGQTFTLLTWADVEHEEFFVESQTGDVVNDAMYTRNQAVEERLNITLAEVTCDGDSGNNAKFNQYIQQDLLSGSHEFQLIAGYSLSVAAAAVNGYLYDLLGGDCDYLNFDQPWWPDNLLEQVTISNKLCFASGDISMNALYMMYVCFVNTDLLAQHNLEDPSTLVKDGKWTFDKFIEMCSGIYEDLDGNGEKNSKDRFGYMTSGIHVDPWFYGSGAVLALQDANGELQIADSYGSEKVINSIDKVNTLLHDSPDGIYTSDVEHQKAFRDEQLLFMMDRARVSFKVLAANENCHYTIVPCPKYDEEQENYVTVMGNPFSLYAIPKDSQDPTMASAVMECFASESYRNTTPAVFEITLKLKYAQDEITGQMYDLIRESVTFDIGRIFSSNLISQSGFRTTIEKDRNNWASSTKANSKVLEKKLEALTEAFEAE